MLDFNKKKSIKYDEDSDDMNARIKNDILKKHQSFYDTNINAKSINVSVNESVSNYSPLKNRISMKCESGLYEEEYQFNQTLYQSKAESNPKLKKSHTVENDCYENTFAENMDISRTEEVAPTRGLKKSKSYSKITQKLKSRKNTSIQYQAEESDKKSVNCVGLKQTFTSTAILKNINMTGQLNRTQISSINKTAVSPNDVSTISKLFTFKPLLNYTDILMDEEYSEKSLFLFDKNNFLRRQCFRLAISSLFAKLFILIIFLDSLNFGIWVNFKNITSNTAIMKFVRLTRNLDLIFYFCYILEMVIFLIAYGGLRGKKTYFRSFSNILDFILIIISTLPFISGWFYFLKTIRYFRIFRIVKYISKLSNLLIMLIYSFKELFGIILLIFYFLFIFSYLSILLFNGKLDYKCMNTDVPIRGEFKTTIFEGIEQKAIELGQNLNRSSFRRTYFSSVDCGVGGMHQCPQNSFCRSYTKSYDIGMFFISPAKREKESAYSFKNINNAIFTLFFSILSNEIVNVVDNLTSSYNFYVTEVFFYLVIIILFNYFIFRVIIGVMINSCRIYYQISDGFIKMQTKLQEIELVITNKDNSDFLLDYYYPRDKYQIENTIDDDSSSNTKSKEDGISFEININFGSAYKTTLSILKNMKWFEDVSPYYTFHSKWNVRFTCYYISRQPCVNNLAILISLINLFLVSYQQENIENPTYKLILFMLISFLYLIVLLTLVGKGIINYFSEFVGFYDFTVLSLTFIEFSVNGTVTISCFYCFRSISVLFYFREFRSLGIAYKSMINTMKEMINFLLLLAIIIYVFCLTGQNIFMDELKLVHFAGKDQFKRQIPESDLFNLNLEFSYIKKFELDISYSSRGQVPLLNFDSLYSSIFSTMFIFVGNDWNYLFLSCYLSKVPIWLTYFYFITTSFVFNIILKNLIVAFLVFHFEVSRKKYNFEAKYLVYKEILKENKIKRTNSIGHNIFIPLRDVICKIDDLEHDVSVADTSIIFNEAPTRAILKQPPNTVQHKAPKKHSSASNVKMAVLLNSQPIKPNFVNDHRKESALSVNNLSHLSRQESIVENNHTTQKNFILAHSLRSILQSMYLLRRMFITTSSIKARLAKLKGNGIVNPISCFRLETLLKSKTSKKITVVDNSLSVTNSLLYSNVLVKNFGIGNNEDFHEEQHSSDKGKVRFEDSNPEVNLSISQDKDKQDTSSTNLFKPSKGGILRKTYKLNKFKTINEDASSESAVEHTIRRNIDSFQSKKQAEGGSFKIEEEAKEEIEEIDSSYTKLQLNAKHSKMRFELNPDIIDKNEMYDFSNQAENNIFAVKQSKSGSKQSNHNLKSSITYDLKSNKLQISPASQSHKIDVMSAREELTEEINYKAASEILSKKTSKEIQHSMRSGQSQTNNVNKPNNKERQSKLSIDSSNENFLNRNKFLMNSKKSSSRSSPKVSRTKKTKGYWSEWPEGFSLFLISPHSTIRIHIYHLLENKYLEYLALFLAASNVVIMALEHPGLDPYSSQIKIYHKIDYLFTIFFFLEMILRIIAHGFFFDSRSPFPLCTKKEQKEIGNIMSRGSKKGSVIGFGNDNNLVTPLKKKSNSKLKRSSRHSIFKFDSFQINSDKPKKKEKHFFSYIPAHFRNVFNIIDGIVTIYALILFLAMLKILPDEELKQIQYFKVLVALRPLTMINKTGSLKRIVETIIMSLKMIFSLFTLIIFMCIILGIVILNLLGQRLGTCSQSSISNKQDCIYNSSTWTPFNYSYERLTTSILTLIELGSGENWFRIMFTSLINYHSGVLSWQNPKYFFFSIFFLVVVLITSVFLLNLIYAVIVDSYSTTKELLQYNLHIKTEYQKSLYMLYEKFFSQKPIPYISTEKSMSYFQRLAVHIVKSKAFKAVNNATIIVFYASLLLISNNQSQTISLVQYIIFCFFLVITNVQEFFTMFAYSKVYFKRFHYYSEFIENMAILVAFITESLTSSYDKSVLALTNDLYVKESTFSFIPVIIGLKLLKVRKLAYLSKRLKEYIKILNQLVPNIANISYLIILLFVIYAVVGMSLFGKVRYGSYINDNNNFSRFENSIFLLFKCLLGSDWNLIMREVGSSMPGCVDSITFSELFSHGSNECGAYVSYIYFMGFFILFYILMMNLFVAIIIDSFVSNFKAMCIIPDYEIDIFFQIWSKYDQSLTLRIRPEEFVMMMIELRDPLGFSDHEYNLTTRRSFQGTLYISPDNQIIIDKANLIQLANNLKLKIYDDSVHIIDAITLLINRMLHSKQKEDEKDADEKFEKRIYALFNKYDADYIYSEKYKMVESRHSLLNRRSLRAMDETSIFEGFTIPELIGMNTIKLELANWKTAQILLKQNR